MQNGREIDAMNTDAPATVGVLEFHRGSAGIVVAFEGAGGVKEVSPWAADLAPVSPLSWSLNRLPTLANHWRVGYPVHVETG